MIITVAGQKGGTKKTTTVLNIAQMLNADCIIDLETNGSIRMVNNLRKEPLNVICFDDAGKLAHYLADVPASKTTVVDCGGVDSDLVHIATKAADKILIPTTEGVTDLNGLITTQSKLEQIQPGVKAMVFPSGEHHAKKHFKEIEFLIEHLDWLYFEPRLAVPHCTYVKKAMAKGLSIAEYNKHCKSYRAYQALCNELVPF